MGALGALFPTISAAGLGPVGWLILGLLVVIVVGIALADWLRIGGVDENGNVQVKDQILNDPWWADVNPFLREITGKRWDLVFRTLYIAAAEKVGPDALPPNVSDVFSRALVVPQLADFFRSIPFNLWPSDFLDKVRAFDASKVPDIARFVIDNFQPSVGEKVRVIPGPITWDSVVVPEIYLPESVKPETDKARKEQIPEPPPGPERRHPQIPFVPQLPQPPEPRTQPQPTTQPTTQPAPQPSGPASEVRPADTTFPTTGGQPTSQPTGQVQPVVDLSPLAEAIRQQTQTLTQTINTLASRPIQTSLELTGLNETLTNIATTISTSVSNAINVVANQVAPAVNVLVQPTIQIPDIAGQALAGVSQALQQFAERELTLAQNIVESISSTLPQLVEASISPIIDSLSRVIAQFETAIAEPLADVEHAIANGLANLATQEEALLDLLKQWIPNPEGLFQTGFDVASAHGLNFDNIFSNIIPTGLGLSIAQATRDNPPENHEEFVRGIASVCADVNQTVLGGIIFGTLLSGAVKGKAGALGFISNILQQLFLWNVMTKWSEIIYEPGFEKQRQDVWFQCPVKLPSLAELKTAERLGLIDNATFETLAKAQGYSDVMATIATSNQTQLLTPTDLLVVTYRQALPPSENPWNFAWFREKLAEHGYREDDIEKLVQIAGYLPPISDLIRFQVREVFSPEIASKFGQYDEEPTDIYPYTRAQGLSDEWVKRYWAAHWDLPSTTQGFEMFQRGVITRDELMLLLRANDVMPFWREKLLAISYRPLTRVDSLRAYIIDAIDENQLRKSLTDFGYSPENAEILVNFYRREKRNRLLNQSAANKRQVITLIRRAYRNGVISLERARSMLEGLDLPNEIVQVIVTSLIIDRNTDLQQDVMRSVKSGFVAGAIKEEQARIWLAQYGIEDSVINDAINIWRIDREIKIGRERYHAERDLTKSEVLDMLDRGVFDESQAQAYLERLGYDASEADALVRNHQLRATSSLLREAISAIREEFIDSIIDEVDVQTRLGQLGITAEQIRRYLANWSATRIRNLVRAIQQRVQRAEVTLDQARVLLQRVGLVGSEVDRIIQTWNAIYGSV
jgi:hypothetical protein